MLLSRHQATQNKIIKYKYYDKKNVVKCFFCLFVCFIFQFKGSRYSRFYSCILGISWWEKGANAQVLARTGLPTMYTLLRQPRLN